MQPEFALPARFAGGPVIAGIYVPRADGYVPLWVVVSASRFPDVFHVGILCEAGESVASRYEITAYGRALDLMRAKADVFHATRR